MVPSRNGFGEALRELAERHPELVVIGADLTDSTRASYFSENFPERFFNAGIAEQNAAGMAAGMSLAGKIAVFSTYGVFAAGRAYDQIRTTICYSNANVKIGGAHGGISVGPDGATHQALEEIATMRVLPRMTLFTPADAEETRKATIAAVEEIKGPVYIRFGRAPVPSITDRDTSFEVGRARLVRDGDDLTIIACGSMVAESILAAEILESENIFARVIDLHTVKPIDRETIEKCARETGAILTAEEHQIAGGMGSAVAEVVVATHPVPMDFVGVNDRFGESGEPAELLKAFGLDYRSIAEKAKNLIKRKTV
ncbi:transketolase family protein [bacterium]|nr:transketolase family protein [bacterium]